MTTIDNEADAQRIANERGMQLSSKEARRFMDLRERIMPGLSIEGALAYLAEERWMPPAVVAKYRPQVPKEEDTPQPTTLPLPKGRGLIEAGLGHGLAAPDRDTSPAERQVPHCLGSSALPPMAVTRMPATLARYVKPLDP